MQSVFQQSAFVYLRLKDSPVDTSHIMRRQDKDEWLVGSFVNQTTIGVQQLDEVKTNQVRFLKQDDNHYRTGSKQSKIKTGTV